jgi:outer membrane receptor protein involved in Fe transport
VRSRTLEFPARALAPTTVALLMASTVLAGSPALAADATSTSTSAGSTEIGELIVTANKREENIQNVAMSVQAVDSKLIKQLNINNFADLVQFMPNVGFQSQAPNATTIYMRGVSDGGNANHSGPQPSVGTYIDEQPITTIGGTIDFHPYDLARVEALPGPQGTLYGASSESGTLRYITNQPSTAGFSAAYDAQATFVDHGAPGGILEGFINVPLSPKVALRLVGYGERDGGFIDNIQGTRPFATSGVTISNAAQVQGDFNSVSTFGGRAALKVDLNDNWTITPTVMGQEVWTRGAFGYNPAIGYLDTNQFQPDRSFDRWLQAALTINGKMGNWDLTYSGGYFARWINSEVDYTDYSVAYDQAYGSGANWQDVNGNPLARPQQAIYGQDQFQKESNELRIASPAQSRFRFIAGLFQEIQWHHIVQDYQIPGFGPQISVPGWPNSIWLTDQERTDRDAAIFGQGSFDVTRQFTITGGIRGYYYDNTLYGYYGFGEGYNALTGFSSGMGVNGKNCFPGQSFQNAPCVNLNKGVSSYGATYKANAEYRFDPDHMVYFTFSTGYRPGGVNRSGNFGPYQADTLYNYEVGWKTQWLDHSLTWNGALYDEQWSNFQFSFLGPNSLTIIENAPSAQVLGVESSLDWRATEHLTISGGLAYNDAKLTSNFCGANPDGSVIHGCTDANAEAVSGQPLPFVPAFKGNVTGRYTFQVNEWDAHVQLSLLYQTGYNVGLLTNNINNPTGTPDNDVALLGAVPSYVTGDLSIGAQHGRVTVEVFVKNLWDEHGQVDRYTPCTTGVCAVGYPGVPPAVYIVPIQPLTVGLKFGQSF